MTDWTAHDDLVERFEARTGLVFDVEGPAIDECPGCGQLVQYIKDHDCYYVRGENHEAERLDDRDGE